MQRWVWRHIRIELPDDWEMLQFSRHEQSGQCAFADRYQFRAVLGWQAVGGPPDLARLASDYAAKLRLDGTMPDAAPARIGPWHGLRGRERGLLTSRFSGYVADEGCLVELSLLWPGQLDESLEAAILSSVGAEPPRGGGMRRWRAFGLDALVWAGLRLVQCVVRPALARLEFRDPRGTRRETFERLGMVRQWLRGSVRDWLARQTPRDAKDTREESFERNGHRVETVSGPRKAGAFRRPLRYEAAAWVCPADGRVYRVSASAPDRPGSEGRAWETLSCCEGMVLRG